MNCWYLGRFFSILVVNNILLHGIRLKINQTERLILKNIPVSKVTLRTYMKRIQRIWTQKNNSVTVDHTKFCLMLYLMLKQLCNP